MSSTIGPNRPSGRRHCAGRSHAPETNHPGRSPRGGSCSRPFLDWPIGPKGGGDKPHFQDAHQPDRWKRWHSRSPFLGYFLGRDLWGPASFLRLLAFQAIKRPPRSLAGPLSDLFVVPPPLLGRPRRRGVGSPPGSASISRPEKTARPVCRQFARPAHILFSPQNGKPLPAEAFTWFPVHRSLRQESTRPFRPPIGGQCSRSKNSPFFQKTPMSNGGTVPPDRDGSPPKPRRKAQR